MLYRTWCAVGRIIVGDGGRVELKDANMLFPLKTLKSNMLPQDHHLVMY